MKDKNKLERSQIDNPYERNTKKNSYKNRKYNGNNVIFDEYTGDPVFYKKTEYINGEQISHTTKDTANTDHIITIDNTIDRYLEDYEKGTLTKEQIRKIANSDYNLAITNEKLNKSKKAMSNHEFLYDNFKKFVKGDSSANVEVLNFNTIYNMLSNEMSAEAGQKIHVSGLILKNKVEKIGFRFKDDNVSKNLGNSVAKGTKSGIFALTTSSIDNAIDIINGKKDIEDAMIDIAKSVGGNFTSKAGADILQNSLTKVTKNLSISKNMANGLVKNMPIKELGTIIQVGKIMAKYVNDEISAEECVGTILKETLEGCICVLAGTVGGVAGSIIATVVISQMNRFLVDYISKLEIEDDKERRFNKLISEALVAMELERNKLIDLIDKRNQEFDSAVSEGFKIIFTSTLSDDVEGIAKGLNTILKVIDESVAFSTIEEYDKHFYSNDIFEF